MIYDEVQRFSNVINSMLTGNILYVRFEKEKPDLPNIFYHEGDAKRVVFVNKVITLESDTSSST